MKVLVVEDEKSLQESILEFLTKEGYVHEAVSDFTSALDKVSIYDYDIVLLDIGLPDGNGLDLIPKIKSGSKTTGIIIISAKNAVDDRVAGLEMGADDYLTKPFHLSELNARLKSLNRRLNFNGDNSIIFNEIKILPDELKVFVHDKELNLTKKEYDILLYFLANKNRVLTKVSLSEHIWGDYMDSADSYDFIYTHIKNLRKKLLKADCQDYVKNVYGIGYKFETQ
ncbi:MAG: response regulator transcription factor [Okeania sp. SIO3C4]|nr:response regulator transcription factor [Okeania sp. SIO3C4]